VVPKWLTLYRSSTNITVIVLCFNVLLRSGLSLYLPVVYLYIGALSPPVEEWQKAIEDQLENVRKLEEKFNDELFGKKVAAEARLHMQRRPHLMCKQRDKQVVYIVSIV